MQCRPFGDEIEAKMRNLGSNGPLKTELIFCCFFPRRLITSPKTKEERFSMRAATNVSKVVEKKLLDWNLYFYTTYHRFVIGFYMYTYYVDRFVFGLFIGLLLRSSHVSPI